MSRPLADNRSSVSPEIEGLIKGRLNIRIDSFEQDLFATGLLDSMSLVQLILELEEHFGIELPMGELDLGSFRSVQEIAALVASRRVGGVSDSTPAVVNQLAS